MALCFQEMPMPWRHAKPARILRLLACGLGLLGGTGAAMAADEPYLQLEARLADEPYQWQLPDGTVIRKGLSDTAARVMVAPREGHEDYVLEMIWGRTAGRCRRPGSKVA
jgi:hypothetical protein